MSQSNRLAAALARIVSAINAVDAKTGGGAGGGITFGKARKLQTMRVK